MSDTYTEEVVSNMVEAYNEVAGKDYETRSAVVKQLADNLGQSVASVRSKLVAEKVYVAKEATSSSAKGTSKDEYIKALEAMVGTELKSLAKATKKDVAAIVDFITTASARKEADEG